MKRVLNACQIVCNFPAINNKTRQCSTLPTPTPMSPAPNSGLVSLTPSEGQWAQANLLNKSPQYTKVRTAKQKAKKVKHTLGTHLTRHIQSIIKVTLREKQQHVRGLPSQPGLKRKKILNVCRSGQARKGHLKSRFLRKKSPLGVCKGPELREGRGTG